MIVLSVLLTFALVSLFSYHYGTLQTSTEEYIYTSEAALRYLELYGSPSSNEEQAIFEYIIYND
jgi:hypothetical protein